jgi:hypothetical protein
MGNLIAVGNRTSRQGHRLLVVYPSASEDFVLHFISLLWTDSPSSSLMALDAIQRETFESIVWICLVVFIASLEFRSQILRDCCY